MCQLQPTAYIHVPVAANYLYSCASCSQLPIFMGQLQPTAYIDVQVAATQLPLVFLQQPPAEAC